jgi:hypothetical protein
MDLSTSAGVPESNAMSEDDYLVPLGPEGEDDAARKEADQIEAFLKCFKRARSFDKAVRLQIAKDRAYASGEAIKMWEVSTNIIGSMIDVLVSQLYARNPDLDVQRTQWVPLEETDPMTGAYTTVPSPKAREMELFALTLQLVVKKMWQRGKLKRRMRKIVRAMLSSSQGWLKVLPYGSNQQDPLAMQKVNDVKDNIARVERLQAALAANETMAGDTASMTDIENLKADLQRTMEGLMAKVEVMVYTGFTFDFVRAEDIQVDVDVDSLSDYLDSNSVTHLIYIEKDKLLQQFPRLTSEDAQKAKCYYKLQPSNANGGSAESDLAAVAMATEGASPYALNAEGELYGTEPRNGEDDPVPFVRVLEKWSRDDNRSTPWWRA